MHDLNDLMIFARIVEQDVEVVAADALRVAIGQLHARPRRGLKRELQIAAPAMRG